MRWQRVVGVVLAAAALAGFTVVLVLVLRTDALDHLDRVWSERLEAAGGRPLGPGLTVPAWSTATQLAQLGDGETVVAVPVVAATAAALATRRWRPVLASAATLGLLVGCVETAKVVLGRQSPGFGAGSPDVFGVGGRAFPSGHSAGTLVVFGLVAALLCGPAGIRPSRVAHGLLTLLALAVSATVGVCTVVLGWHWPSDVVGGWLLGIAVLVLGNALLGTPPRGGRAADPGPHGRDRGRGTADPAVPAGDRVTSTRP